VQCSFSVTLNLCDMHIMLVGNNPGPDMSCTASNRLISRLKCRADLHRGAKALGHFIQGLRGGIMRQLACVPGLLTFHDKERVLIARCMAAF